MQQTGNKFLVSITHLGQRFRRTFSERVAALQWEAESKSRSLRGLSPVMGGGSQAITHTLADLLETTHSDCWAGSKSEHSSYAAGLSAIRIIGCSKPVDALSTADIKHLIDTLKEQGNAPGTINRKLAAISRMVGHGKHLGWITATPSITRQREPLGRERFVDASEEEAFVSWCQANGRPEVGSLIRFLCHTGIRLGAALQLAWGDIVDGWVLVPGVISKSGKPYRVPISDGVVEALSTLDRTSVGPFAGLTHRAVYYVWDRMLDALGIEDAQLTPHACRHGFITRLLTAGVPLKLVQELAGHRNVATTLRYAHISPSVYGQQAIMSTFGAPKNVQAHAGSGSEANDRLGGAAVSQQAELPPAVQG